MTAAALVTVLVAAGVYLILQRGLVRAALGFIMIGHAANVVIIAAGGMSGREAAYVSAGPDEQMIADPLPQAFALTAIVITFALTVYLLALAGHGGDEDGLSSDAEPVNTVGDSSPVSRGPAAGESPGTQSAGNQPNGPTEGREHA